MISNTGTRLSPRLAVPLLIGVAIVLSGCSDDGGGSAAGPEAGGASPAGTGGAESCLSDGNISIHDSDNYSLDSSLSIAETVVADGTELTFDWSAITTDFYGTALDPTADVKMILVSLWNATPEELTANLDADDLTTEKLIGGLAYYPQDGETSAKLLDFELPGGLAVTELTDEDYQTFEDSFDSTVYDPATHTFTVMVGSSTAIGKDVRMMGFFSLDPGSTNKAVALTDSSTSLPYDTDIGAVPAFAVPAGTPSVTVDWGDMTINALGNEFAVTQITRAAVAHYSSSSLSELDERIFNLEQAADGWWAGEILTGTSIDLSALTNDSGEAFSGIDDSGSWVVALYCAINCNNPAPWSITVLEPCP